MTEKPPEDEPGAQERFDRGIANALRMPPKPHKAKPVTAPESKKASRRASVKDSHDRYGVKPKPGVDKPE